MNRIVLPRSAFPGVPTTLTAMDLAAHMFLVGLPIALAAKSLSDGHRLAPIPAASAAAQSPAGAGKGNAGR